MTQSLPIGKHPTWKMYSQQTEVSQDGVMWYLRMHIRPKWNIKKNVIANMMVSGGSSVRHMLNAAASTSALDMDIAVVVSVRYVSEKTI